MKKALGLKVLLLISLIVIAVLFFLTKINSSVVNNNGENLGARANSADNTRKKDAIMSAKDVSVSQDNSSFSAPAATGSVEAYNALHESGWAFKLKQESYGFYEPESVRQYFGFSNQELRMLAKSGDLNALHALALQAMSGGHYGAAKNYLMLAAANGSTYALTELSAIHLREYREAASPGESVHHLSEAFAALEATKMRGDFYNASTRELTLWNNVRAMADYDADAIKKRASEIYSDISGRRSVIGLAPFDNSVDPVNKELAGYQQKLIEKMMQAKTKK